MVSGSIKLECIGCKNRRDMSMIDASKQSGQPICSKCGMPEIVISAKATSRRSGEDLRKRFR